MNLTNFEKIVLGIIFTICIVTGGFLVYSILIGPSGSQTTDQDIDVNEPIVVPDPEELVISNITETSATISWFTDTASTGALRFGINRNDISTTIAALQDGTPSANERTNHYVRITGLAPETTYYFTPIINEQNYTNATIKEFTTIPTPTLTTPQSMRITLPEAFNSGIVHAHASNGETSSLPISTIATSNRITLQLESLRNELGEQYPLDVADILISATDSTGNRYREITEITTTDTVMITASASNQTYNPQAIFTPTTIIAEEPENTDEPIIPAQPVDQPENPIIPSNSPTLPNTSISSVHPALLISLGSLYISLGFLSYHVLSLVSTLKKNQS